MIAVPTGFPFCPKVTEMEVVKTWKLDTDGTAAKVVVPTFTVVAELGILVKLIALV